MDDAVVLGAGMIGLTTAITLAEEGLATRVLTADPPQETTSVLATAMVGPTFAPPGEPMRRWEDETVVELTASPTPGVHECRGLLVARPPGMEPPSALAMAWEPGACDGYGTAFWLTVPLVDMPVYLEHLVARLEAAGGIIERRRVSSLAEAAAVAPLVANCTGLGARSFVGDESLVPVRGPKLVVENPGLDTFFMEAPFEPTWTAWHPHGDRLVLGGSAVEGSDDVTPSDDEARSLLARCAAIEPRLSGVRVLEHRVGLRPGRPAVRLDVEALSGGSRCVHNYGHGGLGVTLAWGCAREAVRLLTS